MKPYTISAIVFMVALSLIPPIDFFISNPYNDKWLWMVMLAGFLGFLTLFIKTSWYVRLIAIGGFLNCFFSCAPYVSFTSYISLVGCCYFYILCNKIEDWDLIFKALQSVLILNCIILAMSVLGKDSLMNFGLHSTEHFGVLGQHMQEGSFSVVIAAILVCFNKINFIPPFIISFLCTSTWTFFSATLGLATWLFSKNKTIAMWVLLSLAILFLGWSVREGKINAGINKASGRIVVWNKSIELANKRPLTGWGIGTYKNVFPALSELKCIPYKTAHNFIIQLVFEVGYPLTIIILIGLIALAGTLWLSDLNLPLAGLIMIFSDAMVHFPDRMIQTVLLIVAFLAYCEFCLRRYSNGLN